MYNTCITGAYVAIYDMHEFAGAVVAANRCEVVISSWTASRTLPSAVCMVGAGRIHVHGCTLVGGEGIVLCKCLCGVARNVMYRNSM